MLVNQQLQLNREIYGSNSLQQRRQILAFRFYSGGVSTHEDFIREFRRPQGLSNAQLVAYLRIERFCEYWGIPC